MGAVCLRCSTPCTLFRPLHRQLTTSRSALHVPQRSSVSSTPRSGAVHWGCGLWLIRPRQQSQMNQIRKTMHLNHPVHPIAAAGRLPRRACFAPHVCASSRPCAHSISRCALYSSVCFSFISVHMSIFRRPVSARVRLFFPLISPFSTVRTDAQRSRRPRATIARRTRRSAARRLASRAACPGSRDRFACQEREWKQRRVGP